MFEDNKAFAVANAIVSGIEGVAKTLSAYPAPWSFAMAGVQAAAAALQVSNILSTSSSSTSMPSAGAVSTASVAPPDSGAMSKTLHVSGVNPKSLFSGEALRDLLEELADMQRDGYQVVIA
jgi:hypothetical protein